MSEVPTAARIPIIARSIESAYGELVEKAQRSREHARRDLGAFDPLDAGWCPFELAGATSEPHWTQWLAGILRGPNEATRAAVWKAIATVSMREADRIGVRIAPGVLLQRIEPRMVHAERADAVDAEDGSGQVGIRPDIVVEDDDRLVVLELKLWGQWNPFSATENQATLYSKRARERASQQAHGVDGTPREVVLINLAIDRCPYPGWVAITWGDLARELRGTLHGMVAQEGHVPARAFPVYALVAGIERTLLDLAEAPTEPPAARYARAHRVLRHFPSLPEDGSAMPTTLFSDVSREIAAHYGTLHPAFDEFERQRSELTAHLVGLALGAAGGGRAARAIPVPDLQKVEGGGTLHGAYWKTPCCARATELGARGQYAGFWLGFCSGHHYAETDPDGAWWNDLVFRADLWFPLPASNRVDFERAALEQCPAGRSSLVEGAHVCIPVLRERALDMGRQALEKQVAGLYDVFKRVDEALLAALQPARRADSVLPSGRSS